MKIRKLLVLGLSLALLGGADTALAAKVCSRGDGVCLKAAKGGGVYHSRKVPPPIDPEPPASAAR